MGMQLAPSLPRTLADAKVLVCCGPGGVGKTTTAAALALRAAESGRRTCVLTIDPARRLAQALGLTELTNDPHPVPGVNGTLDAMMLDMRATFDALISRNARSDAQSEQILSNPIYHRLAGSMSGTQEYMAMEKLHELASSGRWDLIVVDTPPTRSALDFLDAPNRMLTLVDRRLGALTAPIRRVGGALRNLGFGSGSPLTMLASRLTGGDLLRQLAEFADAFDGMYEGFKDRATRVRDLLREPSTAFVVVASPDEAALVEAAFLAGRLAGDRLNLGAVIVNRVTVTPPGGPRTTAAQRRRLRADPATALLGAVLDLHHDQVTLATAEHRRAQGLLAGVPAPSAARLQVPLLPDDLASLDGLRALAAHYAV